MCQEDGCSSPSLHPIAHYLQARGAISLSSWQTHARPLLHMLAPSPQVGRAMGTISVRQLELSTSIPMSTVTERPQNHMEQRKGRALIERRCWADKDY